MRLFRFPHAWPAIVTGTEVERAVPLLDDRDRELEDYLADVSGDAGNVVASYTTGGVDITYTTPFTVAPVPTFNIEGAAGSPHACYVSSATTTGFKAVIYNGAGAEVAAGGNYRIFWHARPGGA